MPATRTASARSWTRTAAGDREAAAAAYQRWLPLINYENRQCGLIAAKVLMKEGGVIRSEMTRHPVLPLHPATRAGLIEIARRTRSAGAALGEVTAVLDEAWRSSASAHAQLSLSPLRRASLSGWVR